MEAEKGFAMEWGTTGLYVLALHNWCALLSQLVRHPLFHRSTHKGCETAEHSLGVLGGHSCPLPART